jgi:hypothetical protein
VHWPGIAIIRPGLPVRYPCIEAGAAAPPCSWSWVNKLIGGGADRRFFGAALAGGHDRERGVVTDG